MCAYCIQDEVDRRHVRYIGGICVAATMRPWRSTATEPESPGREKGPDLLSYGRIAYYSLVVVVTRKGEDVVRPPNGHVCGYAKLQNHDAWFAVTVVRFRLVHLLRGRADGRNTWNGRHLQRPHVVEAAIVNRRSLNILPR